MRWVSWSASALLLVMLTGFTPWSYAPPGNIVTVPPVNKDHPVNQGLVAWWMYYPKLSGGGTVWRNLVSPLHATLTNMSAGINNTSSGWANTTSRRGGFGEVRFDGTNDYATIANSATPYSFADTSFMVQARIKTSSLAVQQFIISQQIPTGAQGGWIFRLETTGLLHARLADSANNRVVSRNGSTALSTNTWYDVTAIFTTSTSVQANNDVAIYLNGVLDQSAATNGTNPYSTCGCVANIGIQGDLASSPFNGAIDDVKIYKRALSPGEIAHNRFLAFANYMGVLGHVDMDAYRTAVTASTSRGLFLP